MAGKHFYLDERRPPPRSVTLVALIVLAVVIGGGITAFVVDPGILGAGLSWWFHTWWSL
jgi:hypothetical protein